METTSHLLNTLWYKQLNLEVQVFKVYNSDSLRSMEY